MRKIFLFFITLLTAKSQFSQINISGVINDYAAVTDIDTVGCNNTFTLTSASAFSIGDTVLIIQMQGAAINNSNSANFGDIVDYGSAGNFEKNYIIAIAGNTITFGLELVNEYDVTGAVQVVSIPYYNGDVNVNGVLTAADWNGSVGGVLTFASSGDVTLSSDIDVTNKGFRGGANVIAPSYNCNFTTNRDAFFYPSNSQFGAGKGEGISAFIVNSENGRGKQANGGGGGNDHNAGGGGGGNATAGGQGGINDEPGTFNCDGDYPGLGGSSLAYSSNRLFLGGGGGAGHGNNAAYIAPDGAGIVIVKANSITGNILANGTDGTDVSNDGGIGGSAGGAVLLEVNVWNPPLVVDVSGGNGGNTLNINNRCYGPGGGGGLGAFIYNQAVFPGTLIANSGNSGIVTTSTNGCNGSTLGATNALNGTTIFSNRFIPESNVPFSSGATLVSGSVIDTLSACEGDSIYFDFIVNPSIGQSYEWQIDSSGVWQPLIDNGDFVNTNTQNMSIRNVNANMELYQFRIKVFNACDSVFSIPVSITIDSLPTLNTPLQNDTLCLNDDGILFVNTLGVDSIQWFSNIGGSFSPITNSLKYSGVTNDTLVINSVNTSDIGIIYRAELYGVNRNCGATLTNDVSLFLLDTIVITQQVIDVNECEGLTTSFSVNATQVTAYQWQVDDGTGFVNIANNATYSGAISDSLLISDVQASFDGFMYQCILSNSCETKTTLAATLNVVSTQNINLNEDLCFQDSLVLNNGTVVKTSGIFLDTITTGGCDSIITYNVTTLPLLSDTQQVQLCEYDSFQLDNGTFVNTAGIYIDTFSNVNIQGCDSFSFINVSTLLSQKDTILETVCSGGTFTSPLGQQLSASGTVTDTFATSLCDSLVTYVVSINAITNSGQVVDTFCNNENYILASGRIVNTTGVYQDTIANGACDSLIVYTLTELDPISITNESGNATVCLADNHTFSVSATADNLNYQWQQNGVDIIGETNNTLTLSNLDINLNNTVYQLIIFNDCDTIQSQNMTLTIVSEAEILAQSANITQCGGFAFELYVSASNVSSYQWQVNLGSGFTNIIDGNFNNITEVFGTTTDTILLANYTTAISGNEFRVAINDACGNTIFSTPIEITINEAAQISNPFPDTVRCEDEERPIIVPYVGSNAIWSNGNVGQQFLPTETGNYTVNFTDTNNCPNQDEIFVELIDCSTPCDLFIPTGFSPNSSGVNDILKAINTCELIFFEFYVYNRFGELIFFSDNNIQGWDGTYKGKEVEIGTYTWYIDYQFTDETEKKSLKGNVSLVR